MDDARQTDLQQLLADWTWLRRLARGLTSDEGLAEDAVQDTFVAAARHPPQQRPEGARGWLATVLRNQLHNHHRSRRRRRADPLPAAIEEAAAEGPSPEAIAERIQLQRQVADLVLGLPPPLRDVVTLSYVEELSSEQIGARLGVAAGTVRWRMKTAVDRLRAELDRAHGGDRQSWRRALLPLAAGDGLRRAASRRPARASGAGGLWAVAAVLVVAGAGAGLLLQRSCSGPDLRAAGVSFAVDDPVIAAAPPAAPVPTPVAGAAPIDGTPPATLEPDETAIELRGVVLDTGGGPIAAAEVAANSTRDRPEGLQRRSFTARTDERGRYALRLPAGDHLVRVTSPGYAAEELHLRLASDFEQPFHLNPEARIAGVVLDGGSGRPVADARVGLESEDGERLPVDEATTDAAGRFELRGLDPGSFILGAQQGDRSGRSAPLQVRLGASLEGVVLTLRPGLVLAGTVADANRRPLAGVVLHLARGEDPLLGQDAGRTGPDGAFRIAALPPGTYHVTMMAEGHPRLTRRFVLPGDDRSPVAWTLPRGVELSGRVVDRNGQPVAGAHVIAHPDLGGGDADEGVLTYVRTFSAPDGTFRLAGVIPGQNALVAESRGQGRSLSMELEVAPEGKRDLLLKVGAGAYLRGHVRWDSGEPARSAQVVARGPDSNQTFTDNQGAFAIGPLPPGRYQLDALWPNFPIVTWDVGPRRDHAEVELARDGERSVLLELRSRRTTVRGQIRDQAGNPVEGAEVQAMNQRPHADWPYHPKSVSNPQGWFQVTSIPAGPYTLHVRHPDYQPQEHDGVASEDTVHLRLTPRAP